MIYKKPYLESLDKKPFLTEKAPEPYLEFDKPDEIVYPRWTAPSGTLHRGQSRLRQEFSYSKSCAERH